MIDAREMGQINPEEFDVRILDPPTDYGVRPWAFVSLGLKLLRNLCTSVDVQELIFTHDLADSIIQRKRLVRIRLSGPSRTCLCPVLRSPVVAVMSHINVCGTRLQ